MRRVLLAAALAASAVTTARAQQGAPPDQTTVLDTVIVEGNSRTSGAAILTWAGIPTGTPISYRVLQRAMQALYATGQFSDVRFSQATVDARQVLHIDVTERPLVTNWTVRGVQQLSERTVRGKVRLLAGRPYDPNLAWRSKGAIDSLYTEEGYYQTRVQVRELPQPDGSIRVVFDVDEGRRVTVSQVVVEGNDAYDDGDVVGEMQTRPEGFWWFRSGEFSDVKLARDVRERLPNFYGANGFIDFQVTDDTLVVSPETGKATLTLRLSEGRQYRIASFEVVGNREFETPRLEAFFPFGRRDDDGRLVLRDDDGARPVFDAARFSEATQEVRTAYANMGYIYAQVSPVISRRETREGQHVVDLRWQIVENNPAIVNRVLIRGNTVTHEDVIRRAILVVPGDVMRQEALIRSYRNISNLGFFEQPLPTPDVQQANEQGDVDIVFNVVERSTGSVNFGATVGQGTGLGGFIGLTEPNLFGRGKRIQFQWQFGRNINDFNVSYTDPALRGSFVSSTVSLHSSRLRYTIADLPRIHSRGGSIQFGFPVGRTRYTRIFTGYTLEQSRYDSPTLPSAFVCRNCILSQATLSLTRDTRIELPFPTGGALHRIDLSQSGGLLQGSGNFRRLVLEGRWYAPLVTVDEMQALGSPMKFIVGLSAQMGFVWGNAGPHFRQLFSMGGTQFGIPLRGYDEFSITPHGFDPRASGFRADTDAFGASYFQMTTELGLRASQMLYVSTFVDAGNVWDSPAQFNPTQLFRGAGVGVSMVTPLGPIGLDYAYGFDRLDQAGNPDPKWKFHFKIGNFF